MAANSQSNKKRKKLTKDDPEFYKTIAEMGGNAVLKEHGKSYFSDLAKKSHPRTEYNRGRPKKIIQNSSE